MHEAYDRQFISIVEDAAKRLGINIQHGVYVGTAGPTFETPAEYRMFRGWGADAVGMSTVPEVIVAVHCGIRVLGFSIITDLGGYDNVKEVSHEEVQEAANAAQPRMTALIKEVLKQI